MIRLPMETQALRLNDLKIPTLALMLALALAGCGRKGPLEAPTTAVPTAEETKKAEEKAVVSPMPKQPAETKTAPAAPNKPFFLDFIL
ncbi:MAG: lipoprotein [Beijerinckiaceae bacterium]|jgi:predicted small lipoprotein YifL|nr:lipoprotein [Beijerinckiaceae bacterium]